MRAPRMTLIGHATEVSPPAAQRTSSRMAVIDIGSTRGDGGTPGVQDVGEPIGGGLLATQLWHGVAVCDPKGVPVLVR